MRPLILSLIVFFLFVCSTGSVNAQVESDTAKLWHVELQNENEYIGTIVSRDAEKIVLNTTELGIITIKVKDIRILEEVSKDRLINGYYWYENPQAARYFWAPNGFGLRKGEGYYQNVWIFFNQFSYGVTDNITLGFGVVPLFLFAGAPTPIWVTPKFSVPLHDQFHLGAGALIGGVLGLGEESGGAFGIAYGNATFGSRDRNITFGLGYGFAGGEWADIPTINFSGMFRIGRRGYILTENYLIDGGDDTLVMLSLGGRSVWKRLSLDYGLFVPTFSGADALIAIPWLGVVIPLGKLKGNKV